MYSSENDHILVTGPRGADIWPVIQTARSASAAAIEIL